MNVKENAVVLRPKPECMDKFMPLWHARNEAQQRGDADEADRLTDEMRQYQYVVDGAPPTLKGEFVVTHLRPKPECMDKFMPLWHLRNECERKADIDAARVDECQSELSTLRWYNLVRRIELLGLVTKFKADVNGLKATLADLTAKMLPYQFQVGDPLYIQNLVTNVGKNDILDKYLKGSAYTQTFRMGLKGTGTAVAGDTQASHAGWLEQGGTNAPTYTGNRKDVVMGSASSQVSTSPTQAFAITSSGTVFGCFTNNGGSATKDDTTGVLFSAGDFTGGSRAVVNLDTLNVVYTLTAA